ncbi:MAG: hypothetical protein AAF665_00545 [Pseudomonadota bacterium]
MRQKSIRDIRQTAYVERATTARLYARLLIPVTGIVLSTALWSDKEVGPDLAQTIEDAKPLAAKYLAGTPLEGAFGLVAETTAGEDENGITVSAGLPTIEAPVN